MQSFLCTLDVASICFRGHELSDSVYDRIVAKLSLQPVLQIPRSYTFKSTSGITLALDLQCYGKSSSPVKCLWTPNLEAVCVNLIMWLQIGYK